MSPEATATRSSRSTLFDYKARRTDGSEVLGRATAVGELELDRLLQRDGLVLISATPSQAGRGTEALRMERYELTAFTNQLATMIQAADASATSGTPAAGGTRAWGDGADLRGVRALPCRP